MSGRPPEPHTAPYPPPQHRYPREAPRSPPEIHPGQQPRPSQPAPAAPPAAPWQCVLHRPTPSHCRGAELPPCPYQARPSQPHIPALAPPAQQDPAGRERRGPSQVTKSPQNSPGLSDPRNRAPRVQALLCDAKGETEAQRWYRSCASRTGWQDWEASLGLWGNRVSGPPTPFTPVLPESHQCPMPSWHPEPGLLWAQPALP